LIGPLEALDVHKYETVFMTLQGNCARALPPSMEAGYYDPPLHKVVADEYYASKTREIDASTRLDNPINLAAWFPERPYFNSPNFGRELEQYYEARDKCWKELEPYDALLMPGGSGPMVDRVNNQCLHDVILGFYAPNKLIAAECYCVTCLAFARDWTERKSIIWGKHVTGHALEYDYKNGTGFIKSDLNYGPPFYPLEYILCDAVGSNGQYHAVVFPHPD
jgi:putative intracellular protease/amidase